MIVNEINSYLMHTRVSAQQYMVICLCSYQLTLVFIIQNSYLLVEIIKKINKNIAITLLIGIPKFFVSIIKVIKMLNKY